MSAGVKDPAKLIGCVGSSHGGDGDVSLGWQFFRIWPRNEMKIFFKEYTTACKIEVRHKIPEGA